MNRLVRKDRGMSIIELLVVITIIGILAGTALPQMPGVIAGHRLRTANNDLVAKLQGIRQLAISQNRILKVDVVNFDAPGDTECQTKKPKRDKYALTVTRLEHKEYNLLDDDEETQDDLFETIINLAEDATEEEILEALDNFVLFTEEAAPVHLLNLWKEDGTPIYEIPINYDYWEENPKHGMNCLTMIAPGNPNIASSSITFDPSGTIKENRIITLYAPPPYDGAYRIFLYRAGQIQSKPGA